MSKSCLARLGGKSRLAKTIVALMPPHRNYCEVFCGAAHVFFAKPPSVCEIINDFDGELINFWRVLAARPEDLLARCQYALHSRALFEFYKMLDADSLASMSPEERAWRCFYLNRCCFGGKMKSPAYAVNVGQMKPMPASWPRLLQRAAARLRQAHIEYLDWAACVARYDRPDTFFYLDPPYYGHENDYGQDFFARAEFQDMARLLANIKGKFLLSINDLPETRAIFAGFHILERRKVLYSVNRDACCRRPELLIGNYEIGDKL